MNSHRIFYIVLGIGALAIASAQVGAYYYFERSNSATASNASILCNYLTSGNPARVNMIGVNVLISYGNGTVKWYNETIVPSNWNAYILTLYLTKCEVQSVFYGPPLSEHFVTSINGVSNHDSVSWSIWILCQGQNAWAYSQVGVDLIPLTNGLTLAWAYEPSTPGNPQPPLSGAKSVGSC